MLKLRSLLPVFAAAAVMFVFGSMAFADTLQLKNGTVVQGRYLGGTADTLQLQVAGKTQLYPVEDILSVTFTADATAPAESVATPNAPVSSLTASVPPSSTAQSVPSAAAAPAAAASAPGSVTVPAGTEISVRMIDSIDSKTNRVGDKFRASLESDLVANGVVVAPRGADVYGRLSDAQQAGHVTGKAELRLELTDIMIHNRMQPILTGQYELAGSSRGSNTAKKAGGGAAVGAIIGAIAGGGKGAAIGAGVGAGAGTAVNVATEGQQVNVPSETLLDFRLQQPFTPQLD